MKVTASAYQRLLSITQKLYKQDIIKTLQQLYEIITIVIPILHMRKLGD